MWWQTTAVVIGGLMLIWAMLVVVLFLVCRKEKDPTRLADVLRLLPDTVRLLRRLVADQTLPRRVRIQLVLLIAYLLLPLDLVPDFIPVVGYVDDAVVIALALRSVTRAAGTVALDRHWPGTPDGLCALKRFAGAS